MTADMASAYGQIALIAAGLVFILVGAVLMPGIARVFFVTQIVYWTLAFVARPLVLLTVRPLPQFGDNIADPRLSDLGYGYSITHVLQPIAISIWIYAALVIAVAAFLRACGIWNESTRIWKPDPKLLMILAIAYVIGLAGRLAAFATGSLGSAGDVTSSNPYLDILSGMAGLAALGLIIYVRLSPLFNSALIAVLLAGELIWGIAIESKTPALSAAVGVAVRFAILGWNKYRLAGLGVGAVVVLAGFGWLQSFKVSEEDKLASRAATASYPHVVQPFLSLLRRFDLLEASTDVYYMDGRPWIGAGSAVEYGFSNLIPSQLGVTKFQSGTEWAQEVRGSSVDMRNISVSLAEGHFNEGLILGGYWGVVVESLIVITLVLAVSRFLLSSHIALVTIGLGFTAIPALSERGVLGITEPLGKILQYAVVAFVLGVCVTEYRIRRTRASGEHENIDGKAPVVDRTTHELEERV